MKAIFQGSITNGFGISSLVSNDDAKSAVAQHMGNGIMAEAVEVENPNTLDKSFAADKNGLLIVVFGASIGDGFQAYGPFGDNYDAEKFAEDNRGDSEEWHVFKSSEAYPEAYYDYEKSYPTDN